MFFVMSSATTMRAQEDGVGKQFEEWMMSDWEFGPYYWNTGEERRFWGKARHRGLWVVERLLRGSEFVGEVVAHVLGMSDSEFQWVLDAMEEEKEKQAQRHREIASRRELERDAQLREDLAEADLRRDTTYPPDIEEAQRNDEPEDAASQTF